MALTSDLQRFRFYADDSGGESAAAALAAQNQNLFLDIGTGASSQLALRAGVQGDPSAGNFGNPFVVQFSLNGGAYTLLTTSSNPVQAFDSANLTDDAATTERLTGGTGTFDPGRITEDGTTGGVTFNAGHHTEILCTLRLIAAGLQDADTLDFHVSQNASTPTFSAVPRITVVKSPDRRFFGMFFDGWH